MSYEDIVFFEEFKKLLGTLRGEINELKEKLKDCENSIKKDLFLQIKDKSRRIFNKSNKLTGKHRKMYEETRKTVFFETIFYWEQYIESSGKSEITDFRTFLDIANLEYRYFFQEQLGFPPNYRDFQLENTNSYDAKVNLIKRNLERSIESVIDNKNLKRKSFEYNNILGDLNLNIFLIIKEPKDYNFELLKAILKKSVGYYTKAEEYSRNKGDTFIPIDWSTCVGYKSITDFPTYINEAYTHLPDFSRKETKEILTYALIYALISELKKNYCEGKIGFDRMSETFKFGGERLTNGAKYLIDTYGYCKIGAKTITEVFNELMKEPDINKINENYRTLIKSRIKKRLDIIEYWKYIPIPKQLPK